MGNKRRLTSRSICTLCMVVVGAFLLVSCASQSIKTSWSNKEYTDLAIENMLIVGISDDLTIRRIFEDGFVENLKAEGIIAIPSHTIESQPIARNREALLKVVSQTEAKTVLITHLSRKKEKTYMQNAVSRDFSPNYEPTHSGFFEANEPVTYVMKTTVYLETKIFDVQTEQLIWRAVTESQDPVMTKKYMSKTSGLLISRLRGDGLL